MIFCFSLDSNRSGTVGSARLRRFRSLALAATLGFGSVASRAMPAAPAGTVETGAPSFVVLAPETLGLSTPPIDLHLLPDGRLLVASQHELAFGDGVRWEAHRGMEDQPPIWAKVAVDDAGQIYTGIGGGIARFEFSGLGRWRLTPVVNLPPEAESPHATLNSVAAFPDHWYWYGSNGAIVSWRPGQPAAIAGMVRGAIEQVFTLGQNVYVSDQSSGTLVRLRAGRAAEPVPAARNLISDRVTCAIPFGSGRLLAGTASGGLKLFEGKVFRPFGQSELFGRGHRITDLCPTGDGLFAASIDTIGIVFFDREGRTVQVLERSLDHRLARVQRLCYAANGVLWALLNDGLARVEFPSPVSHFEPLLMSGLAFAQPMRHRGGLWILADGQAMRGIYDASGRLEGFRDDTPPGHFLFTLAEVDGQLFASNDVGIYVHETTGWSLVLPGIVNARIGVARAAPQRWYYVARGEYGVIQQTGENYTAQRIPVPGLGNSYGSAVDSAGIGWIELGINRVGRLDPHGRGGTPTFQMLGPGEGISGGWVELYLVDGIARFHLATHLYRFDDNHHKFVEDLALLARIPQLAGAGGRPITDNFGRLWYTSDGAAHVIDRTAAGGNRPVKISPVGFAPTSYTAEEDGVVWMFENRRLARMDLRLAPRPNSPLRALITSVEFSASRRQLFNPGAALAPLNYADNSLVIHFAAPADPFAAPVSFEVLLEGAGTQWVSTEAVGSATFYRLKEGKYLFRVRPVAGYGVRGAEAVLRFTVRPPWFRTTAAWLLYAATAIGLLVFVVWFSSYLQRRENAHLSSEIEARKQAEGLARQSEARYRSLIDSAHDAIFTIAGDGTFTSLNPAVGTLIGISRADWIGKPFAPMVHPDDLPLAMAMFTRVLQGDEVAVHELRGNPGLGLSALMEMKLDAQKDESGKTVGVLGIGRDITERKRAETELAKLHQQLLETSRQAGMAEVATGVLHNVGNVLNSVNVSATVVAEQVRNSKAVNFGKLAVMFEEHQQDLADFLTRDARGQKIPAYLGALAESLSAEHKTVLEELDHLRKNIEHIKDIVGMQQSYARTAGVTETVSVPEMLEDALRINAGSLARHEVDIRREYRVRPVVMTDKYKVMQILINLIANARQACDESGRIDKQITVGIATGERCVRITIADNGVGIPPENLDRIFNHGFTTRKHGHGFGLHSGALAARELGGTLAVQSDGPGRGAAFTLELPLNPDPHA